VSKRLNGRYEPDRRTWLKIKCFNREEFVVVGWSDPEGSRHRIGSLLLGYYTPEGKLIYAGRVGIGMPVTELERLWQRLQPLVVDEMPPDEPPLRGTSSTSASANISRPARCTAAALTLVSLDLGKTSPTGLPIRHRPKKTLRSWHPAKNLSPRRLLSALTATSLPVRLLQGGSTLCRGNR